MLERTSGMKQAYSGLHEEMRDEITAMETLLLRPATDAKDMIQPIKKTIKKREKMRVDFENAQAKVTKLQRKPGKSAKEDTQLAKAQGELSVLSDVCATPPMLLALCALVACICRLLTFTLGLRDRRFSSARDSPSFGAGGLQPDPTLAG